MSKLRETHLPKSGVKKKIRSRMRKIYSYLRSERSFRQPSENGNGQEMTVQHEIRIAGHYTFLRGFERNRDVTTVIHTSCALVNHRAARCMMVFPMRWTVPAALLLCAPCVLVAQTHRPQSTKSTYVSPDETFRFDYSDSLVQCKRDPHQPHWWTPAESCEAYTPVCSDVSCDSESTVACTAYAANDKKGTNFEAAAFSVSEPKGADTRKQMSERR